MDFKGFKFMGSKDGRASFKHPKGHYISVATKGLSKEHKKAIEELANGGAVKGVNKEVPMEKGKSSAGLSYRSSRDQTNQYAQEDLNASKVQHKQTLEQIRSQPNPKLMAEGGQAKQPTPPPPPPPPAPNPSDVQKGFNGALGFADGTPDGGIPDVTTMPDQPAPQAPEAPPEQPMAAPQPQAVPSFEQAKQAERQPMDDEAAAWEHDLTNGHVTPETYKSLFNKKDTLGKVGTLFGLMVGGVGGGAHGTNAALSMMDKQIQNDLEAKKASKQNALGYRNMALQEKAQPTQLANVQADTAQKQLALQMMYKKMASFHYLVGQVNNLPEGKQKQQAKMALGMTYDQMKGSISNSFDAAAGNSALLQQQGNAPQEPQGQHGASSGWGPDTTPILKPGASLSGTQFNPVLAQDRPELVRQFTGAQQTDKSLAALPEAFSDMDKHSTGVGRAGQIAESLGGLPFHIGDAIKGLAALSPETRAYQSAESKLVELMVSSKKFTKDQADQIVRSNRIVKGDPESLKQSKLENIAGALKRPTETSLLDQYGYTKKP